MIATRWQIQMRPARLLRPLEPLEPPHVRLRRELGAALASQERSKQAVKDETVWVASNVNRQDDALAPATQALCRYSASSYLPF